MNKKVGIAFFIILVVCFFFILVFFPKEKVIKSNMKYEVSYPFEMGFYPEEENNFEIFHKDNKTIVRITPTVNELQKPEVKGVILENGTITIYVKQSNKDQGITDVTFEGLFDNITVEEVNGEYRYQKR